jgi:ABC-type Fe3+/spermidine/putrescine transport system ATPase subunit
MGGVQVGMTARIPAAKLAVSSPDGEVIVEAQSVTKFFGGGTRALDQVSFAIKKGEFLCLLGPSGSGKTTLLRIIGGLEHADSGCVLVSGRDVTSVSAAERRTNMVFQHHALFPHLSVRDNIAFGPRLKKQPLANVTKRVVAVLELVRLSGYGDRMPAQLSGGQRQRVAIARAIINDPAVLLLDEPLASLDLQLRMELQEELRRLQQSLGSPFIAVTHDQHEAMALADRIAVMNQGRIEQIGTPDEIYRSPHSLFVANFIGRANQLRGVISKLVGAGLYEVRVAGWSIPCRAPPGLGVGKRVALCVREEVVQLLAPSWNQFDGDARMAATILEKRFLGARVKFTLQIGDSCALAADIPAAAMDAFAVGEKINIGWRSDQINVFPIE